MRSAVRLLGVLATFATGLWGLFAYCFGSFPGAQFPRLLAFLMMAPLSVLPAAVLAESKPRWAGIGLIGAAVASGAWMLFVMGRAPIALGEAARGLAVTCLPLALLGGGLLAVAAGTPGTKSRPGEIYAAAHLLGTIGMMVWALLATHHMAAKLQWTLTVAPSGRTAQSVRLDARTPRLELQSRLSQALDPFFADSGRPGPRTLGRLELTGCDSSGKEVRVWYDGRLEAERGRVTFTRSDLPKGMTTINADSFREAKWEAIQNLEQFVVMNRFSALR